MGQIGSGEVFNPSPFITKFRELAPKKCFVEQIRPQKCPKESGFECKVNVSEIFLFIKLGTAVVKLL